MKKCDKITYDKDLMGWWAEGAGAEVEKRKETFCL